MKIIGCTILCLLVDLMPSQITICQCLQKKVTERQRETTPEGVPQSVSETDEALPVFGHQVARVYVGVALHKHALHQLFLSLLFAALVAKEGSERAHFGQ